MSDQSTLHKVVTTAATWTSVLSDVLRATQRLLETLPKREKR